MHLVWKQKKGSSEGAGPRRGDDVFGEGMILGFYQRFVFFCSKTTTKKKWCRIATGTARETRFF